MEIPELSVEKIGLLVQEEPTAKIYEEFGQSLKKAFSSVGFVFISDHGIDDNLIQKAMQNSLDFFALPLNVKESLTCDPQSDQSYVAPGKEIFDQNEDGSKAIHEVREAYEVIRNSTSSNDAPGLELQPTLVQLALDTKKLADRILIGLAYALDIPDKKFFVDKHNGMSHTMYISKLRSLFYPPITQEVEQSLQGNEIVRCAEHSDYGTLTFLYQDDMEGLEVRAVDNSWIKATPRKGRILINVGDLLENWSDGLFPATLHRVVIPPEEFLRKKARQSIVYFLHPDKDVWVEPLNGSTNPKYTPVNSLDYLNKRFTDTYQR
mgnify:FL=1